jgi:hypothetical protein
LNIKSYQPILPSQIRVRLQTDHLQLQAIQLLKAFQERKEEGSMWQLLHHQCLIDSFRLWWHADHVDFHRALLHENQHS